MNIKSVFKKILRKKDSSEMINSQFITLLDVLLKEIKGRNILFYDLKFNEIEAYNSIKNQDKEVKKAFLFFIISQLNSFGKSLQTNSSGNVIKQDVIRFKYRVLGDLFDHMMRSNLGFTAEETINLFFCYKQSEEDGWKSFYDWPISYTLKQVERIVKQEGIDETLEVALKDMLTWDQVNRPKEYLSIDPAKINRKIQEILHQGGDEAIRPMRYQLFEDRLGEKVNKYILDLSEDVQDIWYNLFHLYDKVKGGKPTKRYIKNTSEYINALGADRYKEVIKEWILFCTQLEIEEVEREITYNEGYVHTYTDFNFLNENNLVFLKGLIWSMTSFNDPKIIELIAKLAMRANYKVPGNGPIAVGLGNACIYTLGQVDGLEGIQYLCQLKQRIKQNNTKKLINRYIDEASQKRGMSSSEIEEISVSDFGLINGCCIYKFGDYNLHIQITDIGKVGQYWVKPDGKTQKTTPNFVKNTPEFKAKLKQIKDSIKQIKTSLVIQRDRIDRLYIHDRIWTYDTFLQNYLNHGLVHFIVKNLVWVFEDENLKTEAIWNNNEWIDIEGNTVEWITNATKVSLWHPVNSTLHNTLSWRIRLEKLELKQGLKQVYREVYLLTDAEVNTKVYSNRMAAHLLKQHQFKALTTVRGWAYSLMGAYDDGRDTEVASIHINAHGLHAEFWINEILSEDAFNDAGIWNYVSTDQVRFLDEHENTVDLIRIPKLVFSEIMRDVDLFVGVASVGNDPEWRDNGGLPQYREYWTNYSFGDLTEVAKTRKSILEKLVPKLKIRNVATVEGKFLRIKGKKREYKIHIGSSNILMEPNNEYLCIVPARGKGVDTSKVFLPFEGDRGLSLILSKAFLLADDDKIEDSTILSQINR